MALNLSGTTGIVTANIATLQVTTGRLANDAVTTGKILDANVTTAKILDGNITAPKLNGAQTGSAPIYGIRAWCVFNGTLTATNAPTAGGNILSITRNSIADYTVTFTTAMPSTNYTVHISAQALPNNPLVFAPFTSTPSATASAPTVSSFRFSAYNYNYSAYAESPRITIIVVG